MKKYQVPSTKYELVAEGLPTVSRQTKYGNEGNVECRTPSVECTKYQVPSTKYELVAESLPTVGRQTKYGNEGNVECRTPIEE